ncbi:toll-like receptor 4 [Haliotis rufescens]|uniref:toll-like receptor 4 n=1 Tax=Haliotis rufescens TaxID=6454 RepID=UPI001EAFCB06|nr:toll-like receptor 4 [Haliotis rufescens]
MASLQPSRLIFKCVCYILLIAMVYGQGCPPCNCTYDHHQVYVNCSNQNLTSVPKGLPTSTTMLFLNGNNIKTIGPKTFSTMRNLQYLYIERNSLVSLHELAFHGLDNLVNLSLKLNDLKLNSKTYKTNLFKPLHKLQVLNIQFNQMTTWPGDDSQRIAYPDVSFQHLSRLTHLYIDGRPTDFGPGFAKLFKLSLLAFTPYTNYCKLTLQNSTFINVPHVEYLYMTYCQIRDAEQLTFSPFYRIHTLDVSQNWELGFPEFAKATYGLRDSTIQILKMNHISPLSGSCYQLRRNDFVHLKNTSLRELHLSGNGFIDFEKGTILNFPETLKVLVARWNRFYEGPYIEELTQVKSLQYLDVSHLKLLRPTFSFHRYDPVSHVSNGGFPFPPNLQVLKLSFCCMGLYFPNTEKVLKNDLRSISINGNLISFVGGPVRGFEKVEHFDFSDNKMERLDSSFFTFSNRVKYLNLSNNFLGNMIDKDDKGDTFSQLIKLTDLDMSRNRIKYLPKAVFKNLTNIHYLRINSNSIRTIDAQIKHLSHLKLFDVSHNSLLKIPVNILQELDTLSHVSVRLRGNPLTCICSSLESLHWMNRLADNIEDMESITCLMKNGKINFRNLDSIITSLEKECHSSVLTTVMTMSITLIIMVGIGLGAGYRHRWKLKYLYYVGRRKYRELENTDQDDQEYQYDAFVSYADTDRCLVIEGMISELEDKAGLRLCIHHRDFLPGEVIASNIVNAIQNSRKTLIVLSPAFLKSHWCDFEYNMARMEGVSRRQNIVLVVLYEPVDMKDLPKDMAVMLSTNCYLEYNTDVYGSVVFWNSLRESITTVNKID